VAYDATNIFLQGIAAGNTTTAKLNTYVSGVNYTGVANQYSFVANGNLDPAHVKVWAFKVVGGAVVPGQETPTS
jgi:branched-chain amino acid transport system substrate-binding protein